MRYITPLLAVALSAPTVVAGQGDADLERRARQIHDRVLTLDTHIDISPRSFLKDTVNYTQRLGGRSQNDLVKMKEGGLDAAFLIVYVGQPANGAQQDAAGYARAHAQAMEKFEAIHRLTDTLAPARAGLARTAAEARSIHASGRSVILIGIENGFPIGSDITNVKKFHDLGGRYMSLAHNNHSQLSDSNTGERDGVWQWNGLSPLGREVIREMNRLGMMIDVSHPSKQSMMQVLEITRAPIIASHSGVRAICNHSRNMDDEQLRALARNGGVVQLVAFNGYVKCNPERDAARAAAIEALRAKYGITATRQAEVTAQLQALSEERRNAYLAEQQEINDRRYPADPRATVSDFVDHIDYVVKLVGIDHAGISSDFDGGGGVEGWNSSAETFNVTKELVRRGYTEEQIGKIWSGNLLRVMAEVERVARGSR